MMGDNSYPAENCSTHVRESYDSRKELAGE